MSLKIQLRFVVYVLPVLALGGATAPAQTTGQMESAPPAAVAPHEAYSRGAGAFFAGRTAEAQPLLSAAIEYAPSDPSAHYLRGLNYLRQGDTRRAQLDLAEGARLEAQNSRSGSPVVDRALASVQGPERVTLERIRREARQSFALAERRTVADARRQMRLQEEQRVLRTAYQLPIEALVSRLTVVQARDVAVKRLPQELQNYLADSTPAEATANEAKQIEATNPFADDASYDDGAALAAATGQDDGAAAAPKANDVEIPEEARGSISPSGLFDFFGSPVAERVGAAAGQAASFAEQATGGLAPGGPMPGGAVPSGAMEAGPPTGEFGVEPPMSDEGSPFQFE